MMYSDLVSDIPNKSPLKEAQNVVLVICAMILFLALTYCFW